MGEFNDVTEISKITVQQPAAKGTDPTCPFCGSHDIDQKGDCQTLLAIEEYNHHWVSCSCKGCSREFTWQYQGDNEWYTKKNDCRVLHGISSCFENSVYTCNSCGGEIHKQIVELDGATPRTSDIVAIGQNGPDCKGLWKCNGCGAKALTHP